MDSKTAVHSPKCQTEIAVEPLQKKVGTRRRTAEKRWKSFETAPPFFNYSANENKIQTHDRTPPWYCLRVCLQEAMREDPRTNGNRRHRERKTWVPRT